MQTRTQEEVNVDVQCTLMPAVRYDLSEPVFVSRRVSSRLLVALMKDSEPGTDILPFYESRRRFAEAQSISGRGSHHKSNRCEPKEERLEDRGAQRVITFAKAYSNANSCAPMGIS